METQEVNVKVPSFEETAPVVKNKRKAAPKVIKEEVFDHEYEDEEPKMSPDYKKRYDRDHKPVRGQFSYHEVPGGVMEFSFLRYKEDEPKKYKIYDGEIVELPLMVAEHINKMYYPVHHHLLDEQGKPSIAIGKKVYRASFRSLDFLGEDIEARPNIIQISRVR